MLCLNKRSEIVHFVVLVYVKYEYTVDSFKFGGWAIFVDRGYNSMDVSVFSFGKKTNYFTVFVYVEVVNS